MSQKDFTRHLCATSPASHATDTEFVLRDPGDPDEGVAQEDGALGYADFDEESEEEIVWV